MRALAAAILLATFACQPQVQLEIPASHLDGAHVLLFEIAGQWQARFLRQDSKENFTLSDEEAILLFTFPAGLIDPGAPADLLIDSCGVPFSRARALRWNHDRFVETDVPMELAGLGVSSGVPMPVTCVRHGVAGDDCTQTKIEPPAPPICPYPSSSQECRPPLADVCVGVPLFPGHGCLVLEDPCPAGKWATDLPAGPVVYVDADAAPGGDGSLLAPYQTIDEAQMLTPPGFAIALAKGEHTVPPNTTLRSVSLIGACRAETSIVGDVSGFGSITTIGTATIAHLSLQLINLDVFTDPGSSAVLDGVDLLTELNAFGSVTLKESTLSSTAAVQGTLALRRSSMQGQAKIRCVGGRVSMQDSIFDVSQFLEGSDCVVELDDVSGSAAVLLSVVTSTVVAEQVLLVGNGTTTLMSFDHSRASLTELVSSNKVRLLSFNSSTRLERAQLVGAEINSSRGVLTIDKLASVRETPDQMEQLPVILVDGGDANLQDIWLESTGGIRCVDSYCQVARLTGIDDQSVLLLSSMGQLEAFDIEGRIGQAVLSVASGELSATRVRVLNEPLDPPTRSAVLVSPVAQVTLDSISIQSSPTAFFLVDGDGRSSGGWLRVQHFDIQGAGAAIRLYAAYELPTLVDGYIAAMELIIRSEQEPLRLPAAWDNVVLDADLGRRYLGGECQ